MPITNKRTGKSYTFGQLVRSVKRDNPRMSLARAEAIVGDMEHNKPQWTSPRRRATRWMEKAAAMRKRKRRKGGRGKAAPDRRPASVRAESDY